MTIMYEIIRQKISNYPINEGIEREVVIRRIADNAEVSQIVINGYVEYFRNQILIMKLKERIERFYYKHLSEDEYGVNYENTTHVINTI